MLWRNRCSLNPGAQRLRPRLPEGHTEGSGHQKLLADIRNSGLGGRVFPGDIMACGPLRAGRCGAEAGRGKA